MSAPDYATTAQPFPVQRPEISIQPTNAQPFALELSILLGWGVAMEAGAEAWMAWYDPPDWRLTSVTHQRVTRPARVHGVDGWEIQMRDWDSEQPTWHEGMTHYARLTEQEFEWLAVLRLQQDKRLLFTFLDDGFDRDWGCLPRHIEDAGRLVQEADGMRLEATPEEQVIWVGAGVFDVGVGNQRQRCLRNLDIDCPGNAAKDPDALEQSKMAISYYTRQGELFLFRRYNGRRWRHDHRERPWDEEFPQNERLVINGAVFVHWYDCLTSASCPQVLESSAD